MKKEFDEIEIPCVHVRYTQANVRNWWVFQDTGLSGQRLLDKRWAIPILNKTADFMRKVDGMAKRKEGMNKGGTKQWHCILGTVLP